MRNPFLTNIVWGIHSQGQLFIFLGTLLSKNLILS